MHVELSNLSTPSAYAMLTQGIVPRPVAWIVSRNDDHTLNLAPFSWFNSVASDPPTIMVSIGRRPDGRPKDTLHNIEARRDFVVHIAHKELAEAMTASSASFEPDESEVSALGLRTADMPGSSIPRLAACRLACACTLVDTKLIGRQTIVFAHLTDLWVDPAIVGEDAKGRMRIDAAALDPLGRLGGGEYFTAGDIVDIERPA